MLGSSLDVVRFSGAAVFSANQGTGSEGKMGLPGAAGQDPRMTRVVGMDDFARVFPPNGTCCG